MKIKMLRTWTGWSEGETYSVGEGVGKILVAHGHAVEIVDEPAVDPVAHIRKNKQAKISQAKEI
jgi:hypothetical protein